jgi:hypothetical protein
VIDRGRNCRPSKNIRSRSRRKTSLQAATVTHCSRARVLEQADFPQAHARARLSHRRSLVTAPDEQPNADKTRSVDQPDVPSPLAIAQRISAYDLHNSKNVGKTGFLGGRGGIRTHGALAGTPVFKTGALNHSATLPCFADQALSEWSHRTQGERGPVGSGLAAKGWAPVSVNCENQSAA